MANAMKCDRCGKLYESYNTKKDNKNINGFIPVNLDVDRKYYSHGVTDLCPDCMKEFQNWMKEVKQMERLTQKSDKMIWLKDQGLKIEPCEMNSHHCRMILEKLADYEDLEEQGLLVRLPCKVGDTVYRVNAGAKQPIIPMTVSEIHFLCYKNERAVRFDAIGKEDMGESCYRLEDIGRIVFLTHEEAEKLEEMKNND